MSSTSTVLACIAFLAGQSPELPTQTVVKQSATQPVKKQPSKRTQKRAQQHPHTKLSQNR